MKKRIMLSAAALLLTLGCSQNQLGKSNSKQSVKPEQTVDVLSYVDPFIGTGGHGHTFPGATVPFGMVQLSPDNLTKERWDWTSGYHYSDDTLLGFSHTHLSGTGVGDLLDILVMPFVSNYPENTNNDVGHLYAKYQKEDEKASAGYYSVYLPQEDIKAELTATARVGVHRYHFGGEGTPQILVDLGYAQNFDKAVDTYFRIENNTTLVGYRKSTGWAKFQPVYFVMEFSEAFSAQLFNEKKMVSGDSIQAEKSEAVLSFAQLNNKSVTVKVGISYASIEGARKNIAIEAPFFDFDKTKLAAESLWRDQLNKIQVKDNNEIEKTKFYTALYHAFMAPHLFSDANGEYYGADGKTHVAEGYNRYTLFSLWDTFRALHPLLTITNPKLVDDLIKSMMAFYDESGVLPTWDLMSNETDVMIGYHAVPVIVDAYLKGLTTVDPEKLLQASKTSAMQNKFGIDLFDKYGYIPSELEVEAVSKSLEYAYDDWAIAELAKAIGKDDDYQYFTKRAQSYKNLFDKRVGFMRGKDQSGQWVENFSPTHVDHRTTDYTEANAWQYTWFVPHDVNGLKNLFGSEQAFINKLDQLFTVSSEMEGDVSPDISGLIGQYAHGNEPCHHIPYLYAFTDQKWKGEARIKEIRKTMYRADPDGLAGNDDVGQMSAWYIFSSLGFYPVNPADGKYIFGTPLFDEVTLTLANDQKFTIKQLGSTGENFVDNIDLNGQKLNRNHITHDELKRSGHLTFSFQSRERD
ncbi:GH92 family glycosyl hydrolase [Thalassotalea sp. PP2-459]|uniref:GH92 family glycosyl hydrolase n=1 Tax=Thalassotalea sp. PP2-459 TaxID=1742724 RepID=UPI000945A623|nr:GH92 family glycosyl hydrolase [Thalassotalea sp. PP2-459]OKY26547.1 alpha-mannosidase [Thalassotalea sp. PP2-459]